MWSEGSEHRNDEKGKETGSPHKTRTVYLPRDLHPHLHQLERIQLCCEISHEPIVHIHLVRLGERVIEELNKLERNLVP